jgi:hypothetical protein
VLGDDPESPRFIETVTRRGYRFIAEVTPLPAQPPNAAAVTAERKPNRLAITAILAVSISAAAWIGFLHLRPRQLTEKDAIVLAEFTNATGNPVFDDTLRQGLAVQLEQSPFLRVVSDEEIQQTIRLMKRPPDTKLTPDVAREVCQRTGSTILIEGAIAQIGGRYILIVRAVNCANSESIASTETQAADKNLVAARMTSRRIGSGLYAPLSLLVAAAPTGGTHLEYDRPSTLFQQFGDAGVAEVALDLDQKLAALIYSLTGVTMPFES